MSSIRRDIRAEIISTLANITKANNYNFDVGLISRQLTVPEQVRSDKFPALFVINANESKKDGDVDELENVLQVIVVGYVKNKEDTTDDLDKLLEDVEKCLCVDRFRNEKAINTLPSDIKTDEGSLTPFGMFEFTFDIHYLQHYGTP